MLRGPSISVQKLSAEASQVGCCCFFFVHVCLQIRFGITEYQTKDFFLFAIQYKSVLVTWLYNSKFVYF